MHWTGHMTQVRLFFFSLVLTRSWIGIHVYFLAIYERIKKEGKILRFNFVENETKHQTGAYFKMKVFFLLLLRRADRKQWSNQKTLRIDWKYYNSRHRAHWRATHTHTQPMLKNLNGIYNARPKRRKRQHTASLYLCVARFVRAHQQAQTMRKEFVSHRNVRPGFKMDTIASNQTLFYFSIAQ